jgi:hypothetical protein
MIARARDANDEYSKGNQAPDGVSGVLRGVAIVAALGAILLLVAEFLPLLEVRAGSHVVKTVDTGSHHSYANLVVAVVAGFMIFAAVRGSAARMALLGLVVLGLLSLGIALIGDVPDVSKTGLVAGSFDAAAAHARIGVYLETLGSALLLMAGGTGLLLGA